MQGDNSKANQSLISFKETIMAKINRFSSNTINEIGYYVYGLRRPGERGYFYIGKGKGNRVFSHVNQKLRMGIADPKFEVISSLENFGGPDIDIIRHSLTEAEALLLESALIDCLGVNQLTNKIKGIDSEQYGLMSPFEVENQYKGIPFRGNLSAVCFKINKKWKKNMPENALYEAVRGSWRLNITRAAKAAYGMGIRDGVIRAVYKIDGWEVVSNRNPTRYRFTGNKARELDKYLGCTVLHLKAHDVRGPLFYINC